MSFLTMYMETTKEPTQSEVKEVAKLDCSFVVIVVSLMYTSSWQPLYVRMARTPRRHAARMEPLPMRILTVPHPSAPKMMAKKPKMTQQKVASQ